MARDQREALYGRLQALILGCSDMWDVMDTAERLIRAEEESSEALGTWRVVRALEAGLIVTYARPFTRTRHAKLPHLKPANDLTEELQQSHKEVLARRNMVYAHSDGGTLRQILEIADPSAREQWVRNQGGFAELSERWESPRREMLDDLRQLASAHLTSFLADIEDVRTRVNQLGT